MKRVVDVDNQAFYAELRQAMEPVAKKYGYDMRSTFNVKAEIEQMDMSVQFTTCNTARLEFELHASSYGLQASDFGKVFTSNGKPFRITGVETTRRRFPIMAESNGKSMCFTSESVCNALLATRVIETTCKFCSCSLRIAAKTGPQEWEDENGRKIHWEPVNLYSCDTCYHKRIGDIPILERVKCCRCNKSLMKSSKLVDRTTGIRKCHDTGVDFQKVQKEGYVCMPCLVQPM